jgi:hypothetical protein
MRVSSCFLVCSFALLFAASAWADKVIEKPVAADTPEKFTETVAEIHDEMNAGGRYEFIRAEDRAKVENDLNAMAALLKKSGSVSAMTQVEKVQLFNTQENLNGILVHNDSNRLVCEHKAPVGTSIPRTTCQTVGEIENTRKASNTMMNQAAQTGSVCVYRCRSN